ncbi:glycoside hydrolase family 95-like protein [Sphingobacterium spiritivorum]|uniref:Glycosyl hydrolase family 95 catalytic domain-containing protein n=1 Tax=Sphingobacterium spiritivorum ATCC 33861 TaxID=525373 RepID=D7VHJ4_SPHSI|nr:hypothetical protein [Sphingobacterium spiritivorum]EFK59546.1 hypothetical protein HMPREF0766_10463 [Sphingobacterium spiritivorum ATCC 33861]QQT37786.1 hypothetical protein I6J01_10435 [Sphingobacterium spiritivorum]WQD34596.1 hypothetical protein U0038_02365 [Sphingobacterium spiritivorum]SUI97589.1 Uncharacterised protein [Sphingobacterium spiritivorum]
MRNLYSLLFLIVGLIHNAEAQQTSVYQPKVQLAKLGQTIYEGVFTGNGLLGTMTYLLKDSVVRIDLGRTDVYDHRKDKENILVHKARLPVGHLELLLQDAHITGSQGEMNLTEANATAGITTSKGNLRIKSMTLSQHNIILIEVDDKDFTGYYKLSWKGEPAISPRTFYKKGTAEEYDLNPEAKETIQGDLTIYNQPLKAGGGYAVVYKTHQVENGKYIVASIGYSQSSDTYVKEAIQLVEGWDLKNQKAIQIHQQWWENYFAQSRLQIPDAEMQQFYQMQLYKLACATRSDKPAIDLQGPWTTLTPWPAYWHNLNIQLTYSPVYTANHLDISQSLLNMINKNVANLSKNVPAPYRGDAAAIGRLSSPDMLSPVPLTLDDKRDLSEIAHAELGNLTWMLYYYYQHYRYSMDPKTGNALFPILKRSVNYYLHLLEKNEDGKYHIGVKTYSPEYPNGYGYDTNYDLAILRWGLNALISMDNDLHMQDPLLAKWKDVYSNLIDFQKDQHGFMIARDIPYATSHRHYSHLMMIYPFYEVNWDQQENRALIQNSIDHWQSMNTALQGYSYTGLASMKAMMEDGDAARKAIKTLLKKYVKPNTLYAETGPVIETPLSAMTSIQEMCLQYWDGQVRVFPAIPNDWQDMSFENFRTDGAFLLSAVREHGINKQITIRSERGGRIKVRPNLSGKISWKKKGKVKLIKEFDAVYEFEMDAKAEIQLITN